jgi:ATP-dependent Clp protease ATP-binding subunit ClpA
MNAPRSVVLLDEIEKAHPRVWNTFLQVFDAGRLSDSRGMTADFSHTVIVMTSNIGASTFSSTNLGFGSSERDNHVDESRVLAAVKEVMAPELVNRLDAVVVMRPLSLEAIRGIAAKEVGAAVDKLTERGYELAVEDAVIDLLATTGYDSAYGARHLQRNIEKILLQPLVNCGPGRLVARVDGQVVTWAQA